MKSVWVQMTAYRGDTVPVQDYFSVVEMLELTERKLVLRLHKREHVFERATLLKPAWKRLDAIAPLWRSTHDGHMIQVMPANHGK